MKNDQKNNFWQHRFHRTLMLSTVFLMLIFVFIQVQSESKSSKEEKPAMKYNKLTPAEEKVIIHKGTESPFSGKYNKNKEKGFYICKRCDASLFKSDDKFNSNCGWPSFDDEIFGAVKRQTDADGYRNEILCDNCGAHLGHIFEGEQYTPKNIRHCVNSISLNFVPLEKTSRAIFASGCFWGTEHHFQKTRGVLQTTVGYTGGLIPNPTYKQVCSGNTGHAEAVEVIFDPSLVSYEKLVKLFFETHDQSQINRQGPDIGEQYRSEIFYLDDLQKKTAQKMTELLKNKGFKVATKLTKATGFWKAENYHQDYYQKKKGTPYCHIYTKKF